MAQFTYWWWLVSFLFFHLCMYCHFTYSLSRTVVTDRMQPVVLYTRLLYITCEPLKQHEKVTLNFVSFTSSCFLDIEVILREHKSFLCRWPYCPTPHRVSDFGTALIFKGRISWSETSARNYHNSLRKRPKERSSRLLCGGILKLRTCLWFFFGVLCLLSVVCEKLQGSVLSRATPRYQRALHCGRCWCSIRSCWARSSADPFARYVTGGRTSAPSRLPLLSALVLYVPGVV